MTSRNASLGLLFACSACLLAAVGFSAADVNPAIGYIRKSIPKVTLPANRGTRSEELVPATLDLARRAGLAIHAITACTDPAYDHEVYVSCYFNRNPPLLTHSYHDFNGEEPKVMEALPLLRRASGSRENRDVEQVMVEALLHMMGPDGLYYMPVQGRPWALFDDWNSFLANAKPPREAAHIAALWPTGRALLALEAYALADPGNPVYRQDARRMIDGLNRLLHDRGPWGYFPGDLVYLDKNGKRIAYSQSSYGGRGAAEVTDKTPPATDMNAISFCVPALQGAAKFYRLTGYEPARRLAEKLSYWIKDHASAYKADGSFTGHFHGHTFGLIAITETGLGTGNRELLDFACKGYEFARSKGVPLVGHFPESLPAGPLTTCEGCAIADMVFLATMLSQAGYRDYWEDVDRYVRNQFSEMQLTDNSWIDRVVTLPESKGTAIGIIPPKEAHKIKDVATEQHVKERTVGAIATWASLNDWYPGWKGDDGGRFGWTGCCLGNGARAIYRAWEGILQHQDGQLTVNLLLNRASRWADVESHIPFTGRVDIKMKATNRLVVRIPEWAERDKVVCRLDGQPHRYSWESGPVRKQYIDLGGVDAGQTVTLEFPLPTRSVELDVPFPKDVPHVRLLLKGNDVVDIWPKGPNAPFYERAPYRQGTTLWKKVERFAPEQEIAW